MPEPLLRYLIWPLVKFLVAFIIVQVIVAAMNWIERRLLGLMQARLGPNRVGSEFGIPWGLAQIVADPIKFILKEDIVPSSSEKVAYFLGPMLPLIPAFLVFCLIPYGPPPTFVVTHVNIGLLLLLALTSTGVYGIILGGWTLAINGYGLTTGVLRGMGLAGGILGALIFITKVMVFMLMYIWFRATFPRFRFDQLMDLGWKWMIPLALANIAVTAIVVLLGQQLNFQGEVVLSIAGAAIIAYTIYLIWPRKVVHASRVSE